MCSCFAFPSRRWSIILPFEIYDSHLFRQGNDRSEFLEYHSTHLAVLLVVFDYALKRVGNTACHCERRSRDEDDVHRDRERDYDHIEHRRER